MAGHWCMSCHCCLCCHYSSALAQWCHPAPYLFVQPLMHLARQHELHLLLLLLLLSVPCWWLLGHCISARQPIS